MPNSWNGVVAARNSVGICAICSQKVNLPTFAILTVKSWRGCKIEQCANDGQDGLIILVGRVDAPGNCGNLLVVDLQGATRVEHVCNGASHFGRQKGLRARRRVGRNVYEFVEFGVARLKFFFEYFDEAITPAFLSEIRLQPR
jgi:hypothetical protein